MKNGIVLIGYMGSGKSAVGKQIAKNNNLAYADLDDYIEQQEGKSIKQIFDEKGEVYFRRIESKYLKIFLNTRSDTVFSLGGGTPCFSNNMELINNHSKVISIYLQTSVNELSNRLFQEKSKRPLIAHVATPEQLTEFIAKHLFERAIYYNQAKYIIKTDLKSISEISLEINKLLGV